MVSNIDTAKRALVTLVKAIAVIYGLAAGLTRESTDVQVRAGGPPISHYSIFFFRSKPPLAAKHITS